MRRFTNFLATYAIVIQAFLALQISLARAQGVVIDTALVGTWSSKSGSVVTGPKFYNLKDDRIIEPAHTGISYSFSDTGNYEVAYYRAIANPGNPSCPEAILQWQHGNYQRFNNGSLLLTPIRVDGRQLHSNPCKFSSSLYTKYNQSEFFKGYEVTKDKYHQIQRLNLVQFDGVILMPLYRQPGPPSIMPTSTLHPVTKPTGKRHYKRDKSRDDKQESSSSDSGATHASEDKRTFDEHKHDAQSPLPPPDKFHFYRTVVAPMVKLDNLSWADTTWWIGVALTTVGSILYVCF